MKSAQEFMTVHVCLSPIDFRKGWDGLAAHITLELNLELKDNALFVFINRKKDRIKLFYWDQTGFALWSKRLEQAKFSWPKKSQNSLENISPQSLEWLLSGIDIWVMKAHKPLHFSRFG